VQLFGVGREIAPLATCLVPILTDRRESWVITERVLSQVQAAEMGFLRKANLFPLLYAKGLETCFLFVLTLYMTQ